jgi:hypothetical protein
VVLSLTLPRVYAAEDSLRGLCRLHALSEADLQRSAPTVNGEVCEVLRGAHCRASSSLGHEHQRPGRWSVFLSVHRNAPQPRNSQYDHLDLIVNVFSDTLSSTEAHQASVQVAARIQGPDHSGAVAGSRGCGFDSEALASSPKCLVLWNSMRCTVAACMFECRHAALMTARLWREQR